VAGVVEAFDVAPTMLDYARAGIPANMSARTLRPVIEAGAPTEGVALCQQMAHDCSWKALCVTTRRFKYMISDNAERPERFFDLENDPLERTNLIAEAAWQDEINRHRRLMMDRLSVTSQR
jgi:arylsulfatase A-like enzyme